MIKLPSSVLSRASVRTLVSARFAFIALLALVAPPARADDEPPRRPPLAEPIFTETVTDIDGYEPGEVEFDLNGAESVARRGGARLDQVSVEAEWKVWSRLGVRLEPSFASSRDGARAVDHAFGLRAAAGWSLFHDFAHDFHLQVEAGGRLVDDTGDAFKTEPGEAPLPFNADLKAAKAIASWTLRGSLGAEAGGPSAHAPLRLQLAVMHPFTNEVRFGFFGLEADADFARQNPLVIAPNVWADVTTLGIPGRLGVGIPIGIGAPDVAPATGLYVRVLILTSREARFERENEHP